jgi:hypothetical protein
MFELSSFAPPKVSAEGLDLFQSLDEAEGRCSPRCGGDSRLEQRVLSFL